MNRKRLAFAALTMLPILSACLWDNDTLSIEASGKLEVVRVITGRFERNPSLYYEMRLTHSQEQISAEPDNLEAYDNAGVACDRLGRDDEAIEWMARKIERLDQLEAEPGKLKPEHLNDHRYRYLANLGTFWVHRWARAGADRDRIDEVKTARDTIDNAIELNPNAHFGREKFQLRALDWIISPPAAKDDEILPPSSTQKV